MMGLFSHADVFFDIYAKNYNQNYFTSVRNPDFKPDYPYDMYQKGEDLFIEIPVIGIEKSDIKIDIDENILKVSYEKQKKEETEYVIEKIIKRSFNISWRVGDYYDLKEIVATVDKGLLSIKLPKNKEAKKNKFSININ